MTPPRFAPRPVLSLLTCFALCLALLLPRHASATVDDSVPEVYITVVSSLSAALIITDFTLGTIILADDQAREPISDGMAGAGLSVGILSILAGGIVTTIGAENRSSADQFHLGLGLSMLAAGAYVTTTTGIAMSQDHPPAEETSWRLLPNVRLGADGEVIGELLLGLYRF